MTHPCDGHPCDHCYRCDVLGECCQTPAPGQAVRPLATVAQADALHDAVVQDALSAAPSLSQLVRAESVRPGLAGLLLRGPLAESTPAHVEKEAIRVLAARTTE